MRMITKLKTIDTMETVVVLMMILVCFNFILKQTFHAAPYIAASTVVCALFVGFMWPYAMEQSKNQISAWLSDSQLMLNISILLSIEVVIQLAYCMLTAHLQTTRKVKPRTLFFYKALRWFPGWLIFPVLFSILVAVIFSMPGRAFNLLAWGLGGVFLLLLPISVWSIKRLLPEKEIRLELLFLSNALLSITGVVATVNGRTAVSGCTSINWLSFAGFVVLVLLFGAMGFLLQRLSKIN